MDTVRMKKFITLLILGSALLIAVQYFRLSGYGLPAPDLPEKISVLGTIGPSDYVLTAEGKKLPLPVLRGKVVFLCFWATWCPPCRAEMPFLQKLFHALKEEKNIIFLMVSHEEKETLYAFMKKEGYDLPIYRADSTLADSLQVDAVPTVFIIDPKGNIVLRHNGAARWDDASCIAFLKKLASG